MVNRVILIGNLGRDPEVRRLENGAVVAKFSIATNERYRDKAGEWHDLTEWHDIVVWRFLAERAETQLKKGSQIYLEGKLTHRKWEDKDGNPRKTTEVVGNFFRTLGAREGTGGGNSGYFPSAADETPGNTSSPAASEAFAGNAASPAPAAKPDTPPASNGNSAGAVDDDLPF